MIRTYRLTYYPWITQYVEAAEIGREVRRFAAVVKEELAKTLGHAVEIVVLPALTVPKQIASIAAGDSEIALMNPLGYVFARAQNSQVAALAIAQRIIDQQVGDTYYAQVFTRAKTAIRSIKKARGRSIAFGVPYSTSNFLVPAHLLKKAGIHPLTGFSRVEFLGGHDLVARAVYEGRVDLGAGHDGVIVDLACQPGYADASQRLKTVKRSDPIPSDPIAVMTTDAGERAAIQIALVAAGARPEGKEALARFWGRVQGLSKCEATAYDILLSALEDLGLTEHDVLRRE